MSFNKRILFDADAPARNFGYGQEVDEVETAVEEKAVDVEKEVEIKVEGEKEDAVKEETVEPAKAKEN